MKYLLWAAIIAFAIAVIVFVPWVAFWAIMTIMNSGGVFGFWQWLASFVVVSMFGAAAAASK